jgi:uncharacterized protein YdeI (YjbR/CyaY-like superfamily)
MQFREKLWYGDWLPVFVRFKNEEIMEIGEILHVNSRQEWRAWLADQAHDKREIWLMLYKSTSGKREFTLDQAVEEALCFGWIDSTLKPLDPTSYALRFSPRRSKSRWADSNRARAIRLLREGKMTPAGMAVLPPEVIQAWEEENRPAGTE